MRLITLIHHFFRPRQSISSGFIDVSVHDVIYHLHEHEIADFNKATGLIHQACPVHPLILTKISWKIISKLNSYLDKPINEKILGRIIHLAESIHYYLEIPSNTDILVKTAICSIQHHPKGTKLVLRFDYYNDNKLIATEYSHGLLFQVKCKGKPVNRGNYPLMDRIEFKQTIWDSKLPISEKLPYLYAQLTEIDAPIHTNADFAKSIGLINVLVQGTCTFALALNVLNAHFNKENKHKVKEVYAKFIGKVYPESRITMRLLKSDGLKLIFDCCDSENNTLIAGFVLFE